MNRRSFFGAGAAAVLAGPEIAKEAASAGAPSIPGLNSIFGEALPLQFHQGIAGSVSRMGAPIQFRGDRDRYVYRTGYPSIDALRSISGVHKALMEKRLNPFLISQSQKGTSHGRHAF